jgi:flagellar basal body rod protein FlgG
LHHINIYPILTVDLIFTRMLVSQILFLGGCNASPTGNKSSLIASADSLDVASVKNKFNSYEFGQGNLSESSGLADMAIAGEGLFIFKNQSHYVYFRRSGRGAIRSCMHGLVYASRRCLEFISYQ